MYDADPPVYVYGLRVVVVVVVMVVTATVAALVVKCSKLSLDDEEDLWCL